MIPVMQNYRKRKLVYSDRKQTGNSWKNRRGGEDNRRKDFKGKEEI